MTSDSPSSPPDPSFASPPLPPRPSPPQALASLLAELDETQREAVSATEGPVLVLAGAGSGKTRVITYRIAYILASGKASPGEVLALTFTNKAAREMKERVERLTGLDARGLWITTFHSFGARLLRRHPELIERDHTFVIYDEEDSERVVKRIFKEKAIVDGRTTPSGFMKWKDAQGLLVDEPPPPESFASRRYCEILVAYREALARSNAVDFDDLLRLPLEMLRRDPELLLRYQSQFRYVLVDEYQDTNRPQYVLARMLSARHGNLCAVGDEDQSIYSWRGADIRNILDFEKDLKGPIRVYDLVTNYRSQSNILRAAASVIVHNKHTHKKKKLLEAGREAGDKVVVRIARDSAVEAETVVRSIQSLLDRGTAPGQVAILYRTHAQARAIEERLVPRKLPYRVYGGVPFFQKKEVKDLLAYLYALSNPNDDANLVRALGAPRRGIGQTTIENARALALERGARLWDVLREGIALGAAMAKKLAAFFALLEEVRALETKGLYAMLDHLIVATNYRDFLVAEGREDREEIVDELLSQMFDYDQKRGEYEGPLSQGPLVAFLEGVSLYASTDTLDTGGGSLTLMTVHNAKGLEFDHVFLIGLEEGLFPHDNAKETLAIEEERRLFYVGMTRARETLTLSLARMRTIRGELQYRQPSRFLQEINPDFFTVPDVTGPLTPGGGGLARGFQGRLGAGAEPEA